MNKSKKQIIDHKGFTLIELLIVVAIIAIIVAITFVAYSMLTKDAKETSIKNDLTQAHDQLSLDYTENGSFPSDISHLKFSKGNTFSYTSDGVSFCLLVANSNNSFYTTQAGKVSEGEICPPVIQSFTAATCPTERTLVMDARDERTYYIQKIGNNCWMTTNLAYAGGGDNTYSDVIPTGDGSTGTINGPDNSGSSTYTLAKYYIPTGSNPTTNPTLPSTATDGGVNTATRQYGYLYNWCAAMGNQQGTGACQESITSYDPKKSICPAGWRLPTGEATTGEFTKLNNTVNGGLTNTDAGLRTEWLGLRSGNGPGSFHSQGSYGIYWSSTQLNATYARSLYFRSTYVDPSNYGNKVNGFAVRCVAE